MSATSYQRRKREVAFLRQRGDELEQVSFELARQMKRAGLDVVLPILGGPLDGDSFITDVSSGDFAMRLMTVNAGPAP